MVNAGNPLSLLSVSRMKNNPYVLWILAVVLALTAVDAIPDPPAVNPHTVNVVSRLCDSGGGMSEQRSNIVWFCFSSHLHATRIAFTSASEPSLPRDWIVLTGQAADTSPPIRIFSQL
jgi:hypothetical protein